MEPAFEGTARTSRTVLVPPRPVDLQTSRPNQNPRARWEWVERPRGRLLAFARVRVRGSTAGPRKGRASLLTPLRAGCGVYWGGKADSTPSMIRSMAVPAKKAAPVSTDEPTKMTLPGVAVLSSGIPVRVPAIGDGTLRVVKVPIMCPRTACPEFS